MKPHVYKLFLIILTACGTSPVKNNSTETSSTKTDTSKDLQAHMAINNEPTENMPDQDYATYFVVMADTGNNYSLLHKKMFALNKALNIPIDTMERFYNQSKNLIALPDNHDDEIYAGNYFPRRFPSHHLSLEYLNFYQKQAGEKTIALVSGIYELEKTADSALTVLQKVEKKVFKIKADIYVGCMH